MLGDRNSSGGADNRNGGGDIKRVQPITARAANIEDFPRARGWIQRRLNRLLAQRFCERGDFIDRFTFQRKLTEKIRFDGNRNGFVNQLSDGEMTLLVGKMRRGGEFFDQDFQHGGILKTSGQTQRAKCGTGENIRIQPRTGAVIRGSVP